MGIDFHTLAVLKYLSGTHSFGRTATLGRQRVHLSRKIARRILGDKCVDILPDYCENLFEACFDASEVVSFDLSHYEGATHLHDLNKPCPPEFRRKFSTVFDGGTLQHIYDVRAAIENCTDLCAEGGVVVHSVPANNCCGFGFVQFSPEFFQAWYSRERGFAKCEIFLANINKAKEIFVYDLPEDLYKPKILSKDPIYILVIARRASSAGQGHRDIVQKEYALKWDRASKKISPQPRAVGFLQALSLGFEMAIQRVFRQSRREDFVSEKNPSLSKILISDLISGNYSPGPWNFK